MTENAGMSKGMKGAILTSAALGITAILWILSRLTDLPLDGPAGLFGKLTGMFFAITLYYLWEDRRSSR